MAQNVQEASFAQLPLTWTHWMPGSEHFTSYSGCWSAPAALEKGWEDDINEFLKQEFQDTKDPIESNNQTNKTWISIARDRGKWTLLEEAYTMTVEERQEMRKKRENDQSRPAR